MRKIKKRIFSGLMCADPVPISPDRLDDGTLAKLLAKGVNMHLESLTSGLRPFSPDQRKDLLVGEGPIGMPHQDPKNDKFLVRERNIPSIEQDFVAGHIDDQPVELCTLEGKGFVAHRLDLGAAKNDTDSREKLPGAGGETEKIVRPVLKTSDAKIGIGVFGHHQEGKSAKFFLRTDKSAKIDSPAGRE